MATVPAVPILSHAERQRLAYDLLLQFNTPKLKDYEEYSDRNASLIRRANKLILENSNAAVSFLRMIGRSANYDVSQKQKKIQQKLASDIITQKKPPKPEIQGPPSPREQYKVKVYVKNKIHYKVCTSLFKPFNKEQAIDTEFLEDYLENREDKKDFVKEPYDLLNLIFRYENKGYARTYGKIQGITRDYPISDGNLSAQFIGTTTSTIDSGERRIGTEFQKFELIKYLKITFRTVL